MRDHLDPDHWVNGGDEDMSHPMAKAFSEMEEELHTVKRQLRDAMKLLETAESGLIGNADVVWEQRRQELEDEYES